MDVDKVDNDIDQSLLHQFSCMGTTDKDDLIKQLQTLVADDLTYFNAWFLLDMNNWNLQEAICSYFDLEYYKSTYKLPSMTLLRDVTIGEGESIPPCTKFNKTWRVKNSGDEVWPHGCCLCFSGGDTLCAETKINVLPVGPGCTTDLSVNMTSPSNPGIYESKWRMTAPNGAYFGDVIWAIVTVAEGGTMALTQQLNHFTDLGNSILESPGTNPFASQSRMTSQALFQDSVQQTTEEECEVIPFIP